jgi:hypothetical protein
MHLLSGGDSQPAVTKQLVPSPLLLTMILKDSKLSSRCIPNMLSSDLFESLWFGG